MDLKSFFQFNINLGILYCLSNYSFRVFVRLIILYCRSCLSTNIPNYVHREIYQDFISIFTNAFKTERKSQR